MFYSRIRYRIHQFLACRNARLNEEDIRFIRAHLSQPAQAQFYRLLVIDQLHSIAVAREMLLMNASWPNEQLIRIGLLHDLGKTRAKIPIAARIFWVLFHGWIGNLMANLGENSKWTFLHGLWVLKHHAALAKDQLHAIGIDAESIHIITQHHHEPESGDTIALVALREIDNRC